MTAIKICGLTRKQDVQAAVKVGVNAIGLVFYPPSPRAVSALQASLLVKQIPAFVQSVGLFVNPTAAEVAKVAPLIDIIQFHGEESPRTCQHIAKHTSTRWIKALTVSASTTVDELLDCIQSYQQAGASAILLDAWHPSLKGGTGLSFNWNVFPRTDFPIILAGGLTPHNVANAIRTTKPYAVDVSGGVEVTNQQRQVIKGIKDKQKMHAFIQQVQQAK